MFFLCFFLWYELCFFLCFFLWYELWFFLCFFLWYELWFFVVFFCGMNCGFFCAFFCGINCGFFCAFFCGMNCVFFVFFLCSGAPEKHRKKHEKSTISLEKMNLRPPGLDSLRTSGPANVSHHFLFSNLLSKKNSQE